MHKVSVRTSARTEFVEITDHVRRAVRDAKLRSGAVVVYCP